MSYNNILYLAGFALLTSINAKSQDSLIKQRLPQSINSYQPAIVPIIDFNDKYLYFDRKFYYENVAGIKDRDDIWFAEKISDNAWTIPQIFPTPINTAGSDVLFFLSPDGNVALVSGVYSGTQKSQGYSLIHKSNAGWSAPQAMNIINYRNDSTVYSATLSADLQTLILSLANDNSVGGMDLFVSHYNKRDNSWSEPKSLGFAGVNSTFDEASPYLAPNNRTLYFASNRADGLGGMDLYVSQRLDESWANWSSPRNLGKLINTSKDENSLSLVPLGDRAYLVSYDTVAKQQGIYEVQLPEEYRPMNYAFVRGSISKVIGNMTYPLEGSHRIAVGQPGSSDTSYYFTNLDNQFIIPLPNSGEYSLQVISPEFDSYITAIQIIDITTPKIIESSIKVTPKVQKSPDALTVLFDYNNSELLPAERTKLREFIAKLKVTNYRLEVYAYTDTVGTDEYNLKLSASRAESVKQYLISLGISPDLIDVSAMGESHRPNSSPDRDRRVEILVRIFKN